MVLESNEVDLKDQYHLVAPPSRWSPFGSAISESDRADSPELGSSSSVNSMEYPRKAAGDASSVLSSRLGPGSFLTQQGMNPSLIRHVESNAMSIARRGKLRNAEDLLVQCLHEVERQETISLDLLRIRLKLCVIRLQQGHLNAVEEEFNNIAAELNRPTTEFDKSKTLGEHAC
jgi:hypothetical protein